MVVAPGISKAIPALDAALRQRDGRWTLVVIDANSDPVLEIELGCEWAAGDLAQGAELLGMAEAEVTERYEMVSGKRTGEICARHRQRIWSLRHRLGEWQLIVRIATDGVALRYRLPPVAGEIGSARAGLRLSRSTRVWYTAYQTWYENPYLAGSAADLVGLEIGCPLLAQLDAERHLLVTEAEMDRWASGSHLLGAADGAGRVGLDFVPADERLAVPAGWCTPWRVFIIGRLSEVVASTLVDELAAPAEPSSLTRPVCPGMAVWSWWSDHYSGSQFAAQRRFVEFAAELGWRHLLVDCGWIADWIPALVSHASRFGVQVHLWARWIDLATPQQRQELARWASWGVAGLKVDFMESESNQRYRWYLDILEQTQRLGLALNVHGSVIPRGWARRFPHLLGYEAVRANEYSTFYGMALPPSHNVILPFTRNVIGAMDFTPVAFGADLRGTTDAHELATVVVYECGLTHLADDPDAYRARPAAIELLRGLPEAWQETRLLAGDPDSVAVIARFDGKRWFIGAINAGAARELRVPLAQLGRVEGCWLVTDGPAGLVSEQRDLTDQVLVVPVAANGGFIAVVGDGPPEPRPPVRTTIPSLEAGDVLLGGQGSVLIKLDGPAELAVEPDWRALRLPTGHWEVWAPQDLRPGASGILTVRHPSGGLAHIRAHRRLTTGTHWLSGLPFASFTNHFGPVERDQSNGGGNPDDGRPISVAGAGHDHGLGTCAPSSVEFFLGGQASRFRALVGVDDESAGSAQVSVLLDGRPVHRTTVRAGEPAQPVELPLGGVQIITLAADPDGGHIDHQTHVDWAAAQIVVESTGTPELARPAQKEGRP